MKEEVGVIIIGILLLILIGGRFVEMPVSFSIAVGSSMFPVIRTGDLVIGVSKQLEPIKPGDIAIYKSRNFVVHRVIGENETHYIFKGDNNLEADGYISKKLVFYKAVAIIPLQVWAPLTAILLSLYGVYVLRNREENAEVYRLSATLYFTAMFAVAALLAINALAISPTHFVKPNPLPTIENVTLYGNNNTIDIEFSSNVTKPNCHVFYKSTVIPSKCVSKDNHIQITVIKPPCENCVVDIIIDGVVKSPYNVSVSYMISVSIGD